MNIHVIMRRVPDTEAALKFRGTAVNEEEVEFVVNPYDEYAVEQAIQLKEQIANAAVCVWAVGPAPMDKQLKWALQLGADTAVRIWQDGFTDVSETAELAIFASLFNRRPFDVLFVGKKRIDHDSSALPFLLAEKLSVPVCPAAVAFAFDGEKGVIQAQGMLQNRQVTLSGPPPAIIACEKGLNQPRYPSLKAMMRARRKKIDSMAIADLGLQLDPQQARYPVKAFERPVLQRRAEILSGDAREKARHLADIIAQDIKAL